VAPAIPLGLEYDPDPPFASGHPDRASATVKNMVSPRYETARVNFRAELSRLQAA
jgi:cyclohexyl-isocyanide hydratase